jgi:uncharacterized protein YkwD
MPKQPPHHAVPSSDVHGVPHSRASWLSALAAAALLAACGGGGDQASTSPSTPPGATTPAPAAPVVNNFEIQATVSAPTYAAGSWQEFAFNYLNDRRSRCGFGKLAQDPALDKAAQSHSEYLSRLFEEMGSNFVPTLSMHEQIAGRPLYTGRWPWDRATAAGFTGEFVTEQIGLGYTTSDSATRLAHVHERMQSLLSAPYHMDMMISYTRLVGLGMRTYTPAENPSGEYRPEALVINPGWQRFRQSSTTDVLSYPCEGTTDVSEGLYGEVPDPTNGTGLTMPVGPAILVVSPYGTKLKITSASVAPVSRLDGAPLGALASFNLDAVAPSGVLVLDADTDKANGMISTPERSFLMTHKPLEMGVTYRVELGFTVDGAAKTKVFSFSTRTSNPRANG